jgi:hypothetical protein
MTEHLRNELAQASAELRTHMHSWEYAYAMGSSRHGGMDHPILREARAKTERLQRRCSELRARLAEHEL